VVNDGNSGLNHGYTYKAVVTGSIKAAGSTTALVSSQNPSTNGVSVTFPATVASGVGTPTGDVVFLTNGTPLATVALSGGSASASAADLPVCTIMVAAQYAARGNNLASSDSLDQVVKILLVYSQTKATLSMVDNRDGSYTLTFRGTPGAKYYQVASPKVTAPMSGWTLLGNTSTAPSPSG
jgi:hypothetical protein